MAGVSRLQYSTEIRLIRVMCSGRVDLEFVLRAFSNGMDGVFVGACRLNECNYITHGNYDALNMVLLCRKILEHIGLNPERLSIEFMSSGEGILFTGNGTVILDLHLRAFIAQPVKEHFAESDRFLPE